MFKVGDKVHVSNPKTQTLDWREIDGTIVQILDGHSDVENKDVKIHIVQAANGVTCPIETCYLTKL